VFSVRWSGENISVTVLSGEATGTEGDGMKPNEGEERDEKINQS
jgi:hypothetical protein